MKNRQPLVSRGRKQGDRAVYARFLIVCEGTDEGVFQGIMGYNTYPNGTKKAAERMLFRVLLPFVYAL